MSTSIIFTFISHSFYRATHLILRLVVAFYNRVARVLRFPDGLCPILSRDSAQCLLHHIIYHPKVLVSRAVRSPRPLHCDRHCPLTLRHQHGRQHRRYREDVAELDT